MSEHQTPVHYKPCIVPVLCGISDNRNLCYLASVMRKVIVFSRGAEGPGREILQRPPSVCLSVCPSVCLSVTFSFRTVTQKRIDVFSRNFAGTCTMSWGCAV